MLKIVCSAIVVVTAIAGIFVMRKISPGDKTYPVFAAVITVSFLLVSWLLE